MNTEAFAKAWLSGKVCLHPTDTLPGLSFHPERKSAEEDFMAIKERPDDKRPISLIADRALTNRYWQTLPPLWDEALQKLWPSSLSVIWMASDACPKSLVAIDGTTAFRLPQWTQDKLWMRDLLLKVNLPFPSSSVNRSGETAEVSWAGAVAFCAHAPREVIVPEWIDQLSAPKSVPSTVIRLHADGAFDVLREGAVLRSTIHKAMSFV